MGWLYRYHSPYVCDAAESLGRLRAIKLPLSASGITRLPRKPAAMGPFDFGQPGEGIGFDYFYGFLAGETSQWEPRLFENFNAIEPPKEEHTI